MLALDYPAGAAIERLARQGNATRFTFPRPLLRSGDLAFSFSGLKTALARAVQQSDDVTRDRADLARGFQDAVIEVLVTKTIAAAGATGRQQIVIGGGVACNQALIAAMRAAAPATQVLVASPRLNTDNAAMIAAAGSWRLARGEQDGFDLDARATLPLPGLYLAEGAVA